MLAFPGIESIQARKRELLMESELNRQVFHLELRQIGLRLESLRRGWLTGPWRVAAAAGAFLLALRMKKMRQALGSSFGLYLLRRLLEYFGRSRAAETESR